VVHLLPDFDHRRAAVDDDRCHDVVRDTNIDIPFPEAQNEHELIRKPFTDSAAGGEECDVRVLVAYSFVRQFKTELDAVHLPEGIQKFSGVLHFEHALTHDAAKVVEYFRCVDADGAGFQFGNHVDVLQCARC